MLIKLYADKILPDKSFGIATSKLRVTYNLNVLNRTGGNSAPIFTIGRYICMVCAPDDVNPLTLLFMDLRKNPKLITDILGDAEARNLKEKYVAFLEAYNINYDNNLDKAELVLGDPPGASLVYE